ncbi:DUF4398 domain-containing protein [Methylomonas methanica]|uniref:DUF4398 domain-containing protein n=1 Tax=Methylomonas methanica (strain DSM 25384 / MC09) TaxID=857087 RepID=G0A7G3_METMM|nr:DUF4398 domain-containing protein [Methylomonas methanica]AEG00633.1 hypothetical protein Metme_2229 [Methylomonas methanica MC09]
MKNYYPLTATSVTQLMGFGLIATVLAAGCASVPPPTEQLAVSQAAVATAGSADANEYAPIALKSAMDKLDAAQRAMAREENLLARRLAEEAQVDAQLASATAGAAKAQLAARQLQEGNRVLRQEIDRIAQ